MKRVGFFGLLVVALLACAPRFQGQNTGTSPQKTIEKAPIKHTSAASGREMYVSYCAACHGTDGRGDGPAASALKEPPPDLTKLAENNGGKYPADHVEAVLRFGVETAAHGSKEMPIWGNLFGTLHRGERTETMVDMRIANLTNYIKSLQLK